MKRLAVGLAAAAALGAASSAASAAPPDPPDATACVDQGQPAPGACVLYTSQYISNLIVWTMTCDTQGGPRPCGVRTSP